MGSVVRWLGPSPLTQVSRVRFSGGGGVEFFPLCDLDRQDNAFGVCSRVGPFCNLIFLSKAIGQIMMCRRIVISNQAINFFLINFRDGESEKFEEQNIHFREYLLILPIILLYTNL